MTEEPSAEPRREAAPFVETWSGFSMVLAVVLGVARCACPKPVPADIPSVASVERPAVCSCPSSTCPKTRATAPVTQGKALRSGPCDVTWVPFSDKPLAPDEVRKWFLARGANPTGPVPVCYRALSGKTQEQSALLCSHRTTMSPEHVEVCIDVVGVRRGRILSLLSVPVAVLPLSGPLCIGSVQRESRGRFTTDDSPAPVVQLESAIGSDGQTLVLRDVLGALCRDGVSHIAWLAWNAGLSKESQQRATAAAEPVCESRGVYGWAKDNFEKRKDNVVQAGFSRLADLPGGRLNGDCVDPVSSLQSSRPSMGPDWPRMTHTDLDLDGDGRNDVVLDAGAARWETNYVLYLRREACGYYVGWIPASEAPRRLPQKWHGLFDLLTSNDDCPMAFPGHAMDGYCDTIWRFNGTTYVRHREVGTTRRPAGIQP